MRDVSRAEIIPTPRGALAFFQLEGAPEMLARISGSNHQHPDYDTAEWPPTGQNEGFHG